jgi:hypothetical protein
MRSHERTSSNLLPLIILISIFNLNFKSLNFNINFVSNCVASIIVIDKSIINGVFLNLLHNFLLFNHFSIFIFFLDFLLHDNFLMRQSDSNFENISP